MRDKNAEQLCLLFPQSIPRHSLISWASYQEGLFPRSPRRSKSTIQKPWHNPGSSALILTLTKVSPQHWLKECLTLLNQGASPTNTTDTWGKNMKSSSPKRLSHIRPKYLYIPHEVPHGEEQSPGPGEEQPHVTTHDDSDTTRKQLSDKVLLNSLSMS